jgi:hypothetical protein
MRFSNWFRPEGAKASSLDDVIRQRQPEPYQSRFRPKAVVAHFKFWACKPTFSYQLNARRKDSY